MVGLSPREDLLVFVDIVFVDEEDVTYDRFSCSLRQSQLILDVGYFVLILPD